MTPPRRARPYVMRGRPHPTAARPTSVDRPDPRVPEVPVRKLTAEELHVLTRPGATDPRLRAVDRYLERWAVTRGKNLPGAAQVRLLSGSSSPCEPLHDREWLLVDSAVMSAPPWASRFVALWYRTESTAAQIAEILAIRRRQAVYEERSLVLAYFRGRLEQMGLHLPTFEAEA